MSEAVSGTMDALQLHTAADGSVWYSDDMTMAANSGLKVNEFTGSELFKPAEYKGVYIVGNWPNAELLTRVYEHRIRLPADVQPDIRVVSPDACISRTVRSDPAKVLQILKQPSAQSSLSGHQHAMTNDDFTAYTAIHAYRRVLNGGSCTLLMRTIKHHPVWPALRFLPTLDEVTGAAMLCHIIDPRWFRHHERPNRLSRLFAWLGVEPDTMQDVLSGSGGDYAQASRARTVLRCWYHDNAGNPVDLDAPANFLWRVAKADGGKVSSCRDLIRACRKLLQFVCAFWLAEVSTGGTETAFLPHRFFLYPSEAQAFEAHLTKVRN